MTQTSFINVDLELFSVEDLSSIGRELKEKIYPLTDQFVDGEYNLAFECSMNSDNPADVLEVFIQLLDSLSSESKALVSRCSRRIFDIGYDSGDEGHVTNLLSQDLLRNVVELGFDIKFTLYALDANDS
ncbi:hypothetical protein ACJJH9_04510 [Microbulbifer sp. DLAB2-AF]|uniref:hypothetical protein n=1 Tax=Microbulbifer sp. DLAB2-AF TaxID=3243395 RepID=UPI004039AF73